MRHVDVHTFGDDLSHRHTRRQRPIGILKNDLHLTAQRLHLIEREGINVSADKAYLSFRRNHPGKRETKRRLTRTGLANHAKRLPSAQFEVNTVNRLNVIDGAAQKTCLDRKPDLDVIAFNNDRRIVFDYRRVSLGLCGQQMFGVVVLRIFKDFSRRTLFNDFAVGHHTHPVGELAYNP